MRFALGALVLLAMACGDDDNNEPSNTVTGDWELSTTVTGQGVSCTVTNLPLDLEQDGEDIDGTYGPATVNCTGPGGTGSESIQGSVSGDVDGDAVDFALQGVGSFPSMNFDGDLDGDNMEGSASWTIQGDAGSVALTGDWSADREE